MVYWSMEYGDMTEGSRFGLINYSFRLSVEEVCEFASESGFDYIELQCHDVWPKRERQPERRAENLRKLLDKRGLKVSAFAAHNDFVQLPGEAVRDQVRRMGRVCDLADILGCRVIRTEGGRPKPNIAKAQWNSLIVECLQYVLDETDGFTLAFDNHGKITCQPGFLLDLMRTVKSKQVGLNLDTGNFRWAGYEIHDVVEACRELAPFVVHTHIKDAVLVDGQYHGKALGEGEIPLSEICEYCRNNGYQGVWCVEYEGNEDARVGYEKCMKWLRANLT